MKECKKLILVLTLFILVGCNNDANTTAETAVSIEKTNESSYIKPITEIEFDDYEEQAYWNAYGHHMAACDNGYYFAGFGYTGASSLFLGFVNENLSLCTPLCSDAQCNHMKDECSAYFKNYEAQVWVHNNKIYVVKRDNGKSVLVQVNKDGTSRRDLFEIGTVPLDDAYTTSLAFYKDFVFSYDRNLYVSMEFNKQANNIRMRSLDGKEDRIIITSTEANCAYNKVRNVGGNLFFTYYKYEMKGTGVELNSTGLYCYDIKKGELNRIIDENVIDYAIDRKNNKLYCYIMYNGLYEYDLATGGNRKIYEAEDYTQICQLSADENYLYLDNSWGVNYIIASPEALKKYKQLIVIDKAGDVVKRLCGIGYNDILFGDDKALFLSAEAINVDGNELDEINRPVWGGPAFYKKEELPMVQMHNINWAIR